MTCPRCGNTDVRTLQTNRQDHYDVRQHLCQPRENNSYSTGCGKVFYSKATLMKVEVYDSDTLKAIKVDLKEYKEKYLPLENNYKSNKQEGLF